MWHNNPQSLTEQSNFYFTILSSNSELTPRKYDIKGPEDLAQSDFAEKKKKPTKSDLQEQNDSKTAFIFCFCLVSAKTIRDSTSYQFNILPSTSITDSRKKKIQHTHKR